MRISDWSSDVCSSDLGSDPIPPPLSGVLHAKQLEATFRQRLVSSDRAVPCYASAEFVLNMIGRSEEHTSELQSLMRISYAVFCLKKKKKITKHIVKDEKQKQTTPTNLTTTHKQQHY